ARRPDVDSELLGDRVDLVDELGDNEVRLRRLAGDVRATPAPAGALDEGDLRPVLGRRFLRAVPGGRTGPQHAQVVALHQETSSCRLRNRPAPPRPVTRSASEVNRLWTAWRSSTSAFRSARGWSRTPATRRS